MDALQKLNFRLLSVLALCLFCSCGLSAQQTVSITWKRELMDTTVYASASAPVQALYDKYHPMMAQKMNEVLAYSKKGLHEATPESPLSNLAADALLSVGQAFFGEDNVDFSLTNFGGIRTDLPKGDIRLYDVYASFPFENALVLLDLKGATVRQLFETFAKRRRVEVLGGVKIVINKGVLEEALIQGKPIDDNRIYHLATIDFLLGGGDGVVALKDNVGVHESGITLRDVMITYINEFTKAGESLDVETDGRVVIIR